MSFEAAAERLRASFLDSVASTSAMMCPSDSALSGSSPAIVMAVRALEPNLELHSFSFIAKGNKLSEEYWFTHRLRAAVDPHKAWPRPEDLVRDLDDLIRVQEQPFGSTSIYAQYCVFRLAHGAGIKVMLDGQGADELLAGYRNFLRRVWPRWCPRGGGRRPAASTWGTFAMGSACRVFSYSNGWGR